MAVLDLVQWFEEDEREQCPECRRATLVGVDDAPLFRVCLGCAAIWVNGERIDHAGWRSSQRVCAPEG